ncbi:hypothetical protein KAU32_02055 [bacterium]|nr:hypothetical protein [bacterium]
MKFTVGIYYIFMNSILYCLLAYLRICIPLERIIAYMVIVFSILFSIMLTKTQSFSFTIRKDVKKYKSNFIPISLVIFLYLPFAAEITSIKFEFVKLFIFRTIDKTSFYILVYYSFVFLFHLILFHNKRKEPFQDMLYYFEGNYVLSVGEKKLFHRQLRQNISVCFVIILALVVSSLIFKRLFLLKLSALILFGYLLGIDISTYLVPFLRCKYGMPKKDTYEE